MDTNTSISGDLQENVPKNMIKSKNRITAATRGIQSGTNARVNTFDNREGGGNTSKSPIIGQQQSNPKVYDLNDRKNSFSNVDL